MSTGTKDRYRRGISLSLTAWALAVLVLVLVLIKYRTTDGLPGAIGTITAAVTAVLVAFLTAATTNRRQFEQLSHASGLDDRKDVLGAVQDAASAVVRSRDALSRQQHHDAARRELETAGAGVAIRFAEGHPVRDTWDTAYDALWQALSTKAPLPPNVWKLGDKFIDAVRVHVETTRAA